MLERHLQPEVYATVVNRVNSARCSSVIVMPRSRINWRFILPTHVTAGTAYYHSNLRPPRFNIGERARDKSVFCATAFLAREVSPNR